MIQGGHDATNSTDNPFWLYSIEQYKRSACADFLLQAQDSYQLDVNVLLFIGWLASQQKCYEESTLMTSIHFWQAEKIKPIRQLRRRTKLLDNPNLYQSMLQLELSAEKIEQGLLFQVSQTWAIKTEPKFRIFTKSLENYVADKPIKVGSSWLQALYQHLQP